MGDLIEVKDQFTIQLQRRIRDGKPDQNELCIIYPDCLDHDNTIVWYKDEKDAYADLENIVNAALEVLE
jgi:hypothetical protein